MHHSDNKQTNKYKQNINLYVCIKMKVRSFRCHVFDSSSSFPLSRPYPGFCPLKANYPLPCTPAVTDAILSAGERLSLPLCLLSKDNTDALNFLTSSFRTRGGSPSPPNPRGPPSPAWISIFPTSGRVGGHRLSPSITSIVRWLCGTPGV